MQQVSYPRILIVGAGLSGLSAAEYILQKNPNFKVTVIQSLDRVGGRTYTKQILGHKFDMGAEFIGKTQKYVIQLANRAKQQFVPQNYTGDKVLFLNGTRTTYTSDIPNNINILALLQMQFCFFKINRMAKKVPLLNPQNCQMAEYWDSITVQTWIQKHICSQNVRLLFQCAVRIILGCQLSEASFLYFLWFVHQNESFENLVNIKDGLQQKKLRNGTQSLSLFLKNQIEKRGGKIQLNEKVKEIIQKNGETVLITSSNRQFRGDYLILAVNPSVFRKISFCPNLNPQHNHLSEKAFMGKLIKVILLYQKRYWQQNGYSGQIVSDSYDNPILSCFDDTRYGQNGQITQPALLVFVGAQVYRYWKENSKMADRVTEKVAEAFQSEEMKKPLAVQWFEWDQVPTIGGGPTGVLGTGVLSHMKNLRKPQGKIHFAGTQMATVSIGYMDGAIQSGLRAGEQVCQRIKNGQKLLEQEAEIQDEKNKNPWYNKFVRRTKRCIEWW